MKNIFLLFITLSTSLLGENGLFESAISEETGNFESSILKGDEGRPKYDLGGYVRGDIFLEKDGEVADQYFETSLQLKIPREQIGMAYVDLRIKSEEDMVSIREGYLDIYLDKFDFRVGEQVIVWGRGDGVNPTDNLNPKDLGLFSPQEDDRRLANFMAKTDYNFYPFTLQGVLIPRYKFSEIPIELPEGEYEEKFSEALKLTFEDPAFDGSISYFHGYSPEFGVAVIDGERVKKPYRYDVLGADFATTLGDYGFRGEFAYKHTKNYRKKDYVPNPEIEYIMGIDREIAKDLNLILQYMGTYVVDFRGEYSSEIERFNSVLAGQTQKLQNSLVYRLSWDLFYETLKLENLTNYNIDTKELFTRIKAEYNITDDLVLTVGADLFLGDSGTLFDLIGDRKTSCYAEIKLNF
ncbi:MULTISPECIES: hypothetical protein [Psychrilyobacter]|uniref:Uncharacterized protein n=1 Tax=Psychrilyobacter piezotolerans TaxID=2293438 RepID=A0ABX9KFY4_9FUSO|nr:MULTISPECIES: hypothetical protein [Psychrilyobacter]MCS5420912.1 hypothetical protein [Psychrilyobacter sp. S5]NDI78527.1 hypothetical protein [Psychrilyobacter piezotolerans]RDE60465.1 hypothetical protein DV867_10780 [Psychrilyobacter sp. S5]REI40495.1 hypothetical protein DYH56_10780 [Psychrilyobacter piezotolerans]